MSTTIGCSCGLAVIIAIGLIEFFLSQMEDFTFSSFVKNNGCRSVARVVIASANMHVGESNN